MVTRRYREPKDITPKDPEPKHYKEMRNASYQLLHALMREHPKTVRLLQLRQSERKTLSCVY